MDYLSYIYNDVFYYIIGFLEEIPDYNSIYALSQTTKLMSKRLTDHIEKYHYLKEELHHLLENIAYYATDCNTLRLTQSSVSMMHDLGINMNSANICYLLRHPYEYDCYEITGENFYSTLIEKHLEEMEWIGTKDGHYGDKTFIIRWKDYVCKFTCRKRGRDTSVNIKTRFYQN